MARHHIKPSPYPDLPTLYGHGHLGIEGVGEAGWVPRVRMLLLLALPIDLLVEVAGAAYQAHSRLGQFQVRARQHRVAGQHPQTASIGGNVGTQGNLHREIGDALFQYEFGVHDTPSFLAWSRRHATPIRPV